MSTATVLSVSAALACLAAAPCAQDLGPDAFGYFADAVDPAFTDISGPGANITPRFGPNLYDAGIRYQIPNDPSLAGELLCTQAASLAPGDPTLLGPPIQLRLTNSIDTTLINSF